MSLELTLRIDWSELDVYGHVNNLAFFKYIQSARVHYWEAVGLYALYETIQMGPLLVSCQCTFMQPLFFPGNVLLKSKLKFLKNSSFGLHYTLWSDRETCVAEAEDAMVLFDYACQKAVRIPEPVRKNMKKFQ